MYALKCKIYGKEFTLIRKPNGEDSFSVECNERDTILFDTEKMAMDYAEENNYLPTKESIVEVYVEKLNNVSTTDRGFSIYEFKDANGNDCSIQQSSSSGKIWLGISHPKANYLACDAKEIGLPKTQPIGWIEHKFHPKLSIHSRMHLNIEQAKELVSFLNEFIEKGDFINIRN